MRAEQSYRVKGPLTNLDHPGKSPDILPVPETGIKPREVGRRPLIAIEFTEAG